MRRPPQTDQLGRLVRPNNAVWEISPVQSAIGSLKICQKITDSVPEDQEAVWEDADHTRFCIRPNPTGIPATYDENALVEPAFDTRGVGIYLISHGVVVKVKSLNTGGSSREPEAMKMIRKQAPSVPVPEVLHHWDDPHWFCHITIMRQVPGMPIAWAWYKLDPVHQQRLVQEIADHIQAVGEIQSEIAIYANGESLADGKLIPKGPNYEFDIPDHNDYYFNMKQLKEFLDAEDWPHKCPPEGLGDRFHFCHMDPSPWHFFIYNGVEPPPPGLVQNIPLEEQAKLHISGIIDWERSGFFPRYMVSHQFQGLPLLGLPDHQYGMPSRTADEFEDAVGDELVKRGFPDISVIKYR